jgi:hypothetical protein
MGLLFEPSCDAGAQLHDGLPDATVTTRRIRASREARRRHTTELTEYSSRSTRRTGRAFPSGRRAQRGTGVQRGGVEPFPAYRPVVMASWGGLPDCGWAGRARQPGAYRLCRRAGQPVRSPSREARRRACPGGWSSGQDEVVPAQGQLHSKPLRRRRWNRLWALPACRCGWRSAGMPSMIIVRALCLAQPLRAEWERFTARLPNMISTLQCPAPQATIDQRSRGVQQRTSAHRGRSICVATHAPASPAAPPAQRPSGQRRILRHQHCDELTRTAGTVCAVAGVPAL